jgi:hypothetical protein
MDRELEIKNRCVEIILERAQIWKWSRISVEDVTAAIYSSIVPEEKEILVNSNKE